MSHTKDTPLFCVLQAKKKRNVGIMKNRFTNPSTRGIMSGILLSPGPIATKESVKGVSRCFHSAVNNVKFLAVATKLDEAGFGWLQQMGQSVKVFVKRPPEQMYELLQRKENQDLCTVDEYDVRYRLPLTTTISKQVQDQLVQLNIVKEEMIS